MGKTALSLMLSNIYPNATGKESVYVTNKSLSEVLTLEQFSQDSVSVEKSINVVTALSSTENLSKDDILDYAYRPTNTSALLFDIYSENVKFEEAYENFSSVIRKLGNRFIIYDINGSVYDEDVKTLINDCDVVLYLFRPIKSECMEARDYLESLSEDEKIKVKLVCSMWDDSGVKKKTIQEYMKIRANSILWFPYHRNIQRTMFENRLCVLNRLIIEGRDQCLNLRQPLKDILSFIFDVNGVKVIKDVNKWSL